MEKHSKKKRSDLGITESSGNVFADLKIPNPEEMMAKAEIAGRIFCIIEDRGLTQVEAARHCSFNCVNGDLHSDRRSHAIAIDQSQ